MELAHIRLKDPDRPLGLYRRCKNVRNYLASRLEFSMQSTESGRASLRVNSKPLQNSAAKIKFTRDRVNSATTEASTKRSSTVVVVLLEQTRRREEGYVTILGFRLRQ